MKTRRLKIISYLLAIALMLAPVGIADVPAVGAGSGRAAENAAETSRGGTAAAESTSDASEGDVFDQVESAIEDHEGEYDGFVVQLKDPDDEKAEIEAAEIEAAEKEIDEAIDDGAAIEDMEYVDGAYKADDLETIRETIDEEVIDFIEPDYFVYAADDTTDRTAIANTALTAVPSAGTAVAADTADNAVVRASSAVEPNDYYYASDQYNLPMINTQYAWACGMEGQDLDASVDMDGNGKSTDEKLVIAVIDSGINADHEDIDSSRIVGGKNFSGGAENDLNDICGHGTKVTSVIMAAKDNYVGMAGILQKAYVMPVRVFRENEETKASVINNAINFAVDQKVTYDETNGALGTNVAVINLSLGTDRRLTSMQQACDKAVENGIIVVCAAGNVSSDMPQYSAQYPAQFTMGVGSVTVNGTANPGALWLSSDNGDGYANKVWVTAPGKQIMTCGIESNSDYWYMEGTSFATPQVSALALLCKSLKNDLTQKEFMALLKTTSTAKTGELGKYSGQDIQYGWGIVNYEKTLDALMKAQGKSIPAKTIYRLYNPKSKEHLWTTDKNEYNVLAKSYGWRQEGIAWYAPVYGKAVYRLYNKKTGDHHYTSDLNETKVLTTQYGWRYDNNARPVFYSGGSTPVYRLYNRKLTRGAHHFTKSANEYNVLPSYGWKQEGVAFYCKK